MISFRTDRLKELRKDTGKTQKQFSESIGCTMASLSAYENGTKLPPTQTLINISNEYKCSFDWLMGLKDEKDYDTNDNSVKTYSDYIRRLFALQCSPIRFERGCECIGASKNLSACKGIAFWDPIINLFLDSWHKTYTLYTEGTIDDTIYEAWQEKILRDFKYHILSGDCDWENFEQAYHSFKQDVELSEYDAIQAALIDTRTSSSYKPDTEAENN